MSRPAICSGDFEAITAEDGEKGCEKAVSERPDIILMDLQMPVMDGWEAARRLKSIPETSDIPIIGLSAHALAGERDKALGEGCDRYKAHRVRASCCDDPAALRDAIGSKGRLIRNEAASPLSVPSPWVWRTERP